jgi:hypothetical protein
LVAAAVTAPIIFYGDINYNFSSVWSDWNGAGLFTTQAEGPADIIAIMDIGACLYYCFMDLANVYPYAGIEDGE